MYFPIVMFVRFYISKKSTYRAHFNQIMALFLQKLMFNAVSLVLYPSGLAACFLGQAIFSSVPRFLSRAVQVQICQPFAEKNVRLSSRHAIVDLPVAVNNDSDNGKDDLKKVE
jgi:hypothetical protein